MPSFVLLNQNTTLAPNVGILTNWLPKSITRKQMIKCIYTTAAITQGVRKMQYLTVCSLDAKGSAQKIDTSIWRSKKL